jgi:rubredoxin
MSDQLTQSQIDDLKADLAYHERQADLIRERLARAPVPDLVPERDACPECRERDADKLEWLNDEDEQVQCQTCGFIYTVPRA